MTVPIPVVVAIVHAVEAVGGDLSDIQDLCRVWERVTVRAELRADSIRREARSRECCCANRPAPGRDGRCPVCFGRSKATTPTGGGDSTA